MKRRGYAPVYEKLAALLREERLRAGLTQAALAAKLGRPQSFIAKYERGERQLDLIEFLLLVRALGVRSAPLVQRLERLL